MRRLVDEASPMVITPGGLAEYRVAIVTGGSRGIGRATADRLAQLDYAVVVNYLHDQRTAEETVDAILDRRGTAVAVRADVADELDVKRLFDATSEAFGAVDAVVHSVRGAGSEDSVVEVSIDNLDTVLRTSVLATAIVNRAAGRHVRDGGAIVNLSSTVGATVLPSYGAHAVTSAAIDALTRLLADELRERDITVNAVSLEVDKPCAPGSVADLVAYLLSDAGHKITGQVIHLDHRIEL
jgi:3-oxoacyl-[acyl-carrier protein] reductase